MKNRRWFWVSLPHVTYAVEHDGDYVTDTAPVARWMIGKSVNDVAHYLAIKGARVEPLDPTRDRHD